MDPGRRAVRIDRRPTPPRHRLRDDGSGEGAIGLRPGMRGGEPDDAPPVPRSLREPHTLSDRRFENGEPVPGADVLENLARVDGSRVEHRGEETGHLEPA